jgi:hypothetical protein
MYIPVHAGSRIRTRLPIRRGIKHCLNFPIYLIKEKVYKNVLINTVFVILSMTNYFKEYPYSINVNKYVDNPSFLWHMLHVCDTYKRRHVSNSISLLSLLLLISNEGTWIQFLTWENNFYSCWELLNTWSSIHLPNTMDIIFLSMFSMLKPSIQTENTWLARVCLNVNSTVIANHGSWLYNMNSY